MKRRFFFILIGIIVLVAGAIGVSTNFLHRESQQEPRETISIGNVKEYSIFNIIAKEKGYFAENGVDAGVIEYESGPQAVKALLAGKVDVALASDNAGVQTIFTNPELRIVAQFVRNRVFSVIARVDKGISQPADLRGKRIGVTKKSAGEFLFSRFLTFQNLTQQDVLIIDLTPSQIKTELQRGTIDAGILFEPNIFDLIHTLGENTIVWPIEDGYYTFGLIYTTDTIIKTHPQLIHRYLQSLITAEKYVEKYPTETKELIGKRLGYSEEYIDYSWPKNNHSIALSQELILSMENIAEWVIKNKLTNKTNVPNYLDYIYFDALESVKPESVSIIH